MIRPRGNWGCVALVVTLFIVGWDQLLADDVPPSCDVQGDNLQIRAGQTTLLVSLRSPVFVVSDTLSVGAVGPGNAQRPVPGDPTWEVAFPLLRLENSAALEVKLYLHWSASESVLRKWARFRLVESTQPQLLLEIVLDRIAVQGDPVWSHGGGRCGSPRQLIVDDGPQSHPFFVPGRFFGIEYPVAAARCEQSHVVLAHRPGLTMEPNTWYESKKAVYGITPPGGEVAVFQRYIDALRPEPRGLHVNYNSWWTSPVPYAEQDILSLMQEFHDHLYQTHDVALDTFCIDLGWSDPRSIWDIDQGRFPHGFANIRDAARRMGANLGLWISPSSYYPGALDNDWAQGQGYESYTVAGHGGAQAKVRLLCLGGPRYGSQFRRALTELVGRWTIQHLKLDGCHLVCPAQDHGHAPGEYSSEAIAANFIRAVEAARSANPNVWVETTCFGFNPSPWWLRHVNSVIGTFGDDAPAGRVPAPVYRESYTSARDYFNLQGSALLPIPSGAQEVLGIVHQTPEPFLNDAAITVLRGHQFLPLYVNPKYMDAARWRTLADLLRWTRERSSTLANAIPLLPNSWQGESLPRFSDDSVMPREPYGYAHRQESGVLIALRNPWIACQAYRLVLDDRLGCSPDDSELSIVSLYPESRYYAGGLRYGDTWDLPLAPYETVVLAIDHRPSVEGQTGTTDEARSRVQVVRAACRLERVKFKDSPATLGPDWTALLGNASAAVRVTVNAEVSVPASSAEMLVLCEGAVGAGSPVGNLTVNGRRVAMQTEFSSAGWSATVRPHHEHWTLVRAPLGRGDNRISGELLAAGDHRQVSVWVWATKRTEERKGRGSLPPPEVISLGGAALLQPVDVSRLPEAREPIDRPVDRIDGRFLDTLEPASVTQGWGTLQRNRSVWEKPMIIGGQTFARGLGTHAPSKIEYDLKGEFRRFQSWVGADSNTYPTITFEVWIDGVKRWESELMTRDHRPVWVDLDVTGARTLTLVVGDAGSLPADHADWAEARLLY